MASLLSLQKKPTVSFDTETLIGENVILKVEDNRPPETDQLRDEAIRDWYDREYKFEQLYDIASWEDRLVHAMRKEHKLNDRQKRNAGQLEYAFRHPMTPLAHKILDKYKKRSAVDVKKNQQKIREQIAKRRNRVRDKIQNQSRKANKRKH